MKEVRKRASPNYDGLQAFMMSLWDPPVTNFDSPFAGVGEGVDYGFIDRDWDKVTG